MKLLQATVPRCTTKVVLQGFVLASDAVILLHLFLPSANAPNVSTNFVKRLFEPSIYYPTRPPCVIMHVRGGEYNPGFLTGIPHSNAQVDLLRFRRQVSVQPDLALFYFQSIS